MYLVISVSEDGIRIYHTTKPELEEKLNEEFWGDVEIQTNIPEERDPQYWPSGLWIFKGKTILPKTKAYTVD